MIINTILFGSFCVVIDNHKIDLSKRENELLALLIVSRGQKITAKNYWEIIIRPQKYAYNARFYASTAKLLHQTLAKYGADEILEMGWDPVRFCRINVNAIKCDYYDMLDGRVKRMSEECFLPDYPWASDFYCRSQEELFDLLNTTP